jgi:hypothetical protein
MSVVIFLGNLAPIPNPQHPKIIINIMLFKTKNFNVTPAELRRLIATHYFRQRRNLLIFCAVMTVVSILFSSVEGSIFGAGYFSFLFSCLLIAPFLINLKKTQAAVNFISRYWEVDETFITIYYEDGSIGKFRFEHLIKALKKKEYYFLYITAAGQFHYLPIAAFESEKDMHRFDLLLEGKQLLKLW